MLITRHIFRPSVVGKNDIFKLPDLRGGRIFVSQRFVDLWQSAGLRGLKFTPAHLDPFELRKQ